MTQPLRILTIVSQPFAENTYILFQASPDAESPRDPQGRLPALVVDPGFDPEAILEALEENNLYLEAIWNTHGHADHIAGNAAMKQAFPNAPLVIGHGDAVMLTDPQKNLSWLGGMRVISPPADQLLHEGDTVMSLGINWLIREIPGHSPGHVVMISQSQLTPSIVLGGDVLFEGSIGRTDFPGGSFEQLAAGIRGKLYTLPDETVVYPGHGEPTTIGNEKRYNPFVPG